MKVVNETFRIHVDQGQEVGIPSLPRQVQGTRGAPERLGRPIEPQTVVAEENE